MRLTLDQRFDFRGRAVAWGCAGSGDPVVLVHGTPFSAQVWRRIAPCLAIDHKVYWFDLLGYGASDMSVGQDVSLGIQNDVMAALFAHWGITRPTVIAHDFGGATALRAALLNGLDFAHLMLIDPVVLSPWGSPFVQHVRRHEGAFAQLPTYVHDAILDAYLQGAVVRPLADDARDILAAPWKGALGQQAFYAQIAQMDTRHTDVIEGRLHELTCPGTLIWGEDDAWVPIAQGRQLHDALPGFTFVAVPDAGHLVQEDAPEAIVAAFLRRRMSLPGQGLPRMPCGAG